MCFKLSITSDWRSLLLLIPKLKHQRAKGLIEAFYSTTVVVKVLLVMGEGEKQLQRTRGRMNGANAGSKRTKGPVCIWRTAIWLSWAASHDRGGQIPPQLLPLNPHNTVLMDRGPSLTVYPHFSHKATRGNWKLVCVILKEIMEFYRNRTRT